MDKDGLSTSPARPPEAKHARRGRAASSAIALALGLALACAGVLVPRGWAAAHASAQEGGRTPANEANHRVSHREAGEYGRGGAGESASASEAGEYGAGSEGSEYGRGYASDDDSSYFPAPVAKLRAAAKANPPASAESETRAIDTTLLGPEHAAEHAAVRRAERNWARLGHQPRMQNPKDALSSRGAPPVQNAGNEAPPSEVGEWTTSPFNLPTYAINATVLATGKVLFWGRPPDPLGVDPRANVGQAAVWSPSMGTGPDAFQDVAPPVIDPDGPGGQAPVPAPIFCSGLSQLPDGEVLVSGGTMVYADSAPDDAYTYYAGLRTVFSFDPFSESWTQQPDMAHGRWYPSQTLLPDGRTIFTGGLTEDAPGGVLNRTVEVFNPPSALGGLGSIDEAPTADRALGTYPRTFSVGDNLLVAGPRKDRVATLDTTDFTWRSGPPAMSRTRQHDTAVRTPGGTDGSNTFTEIGGYAGKDVGGGGEDGGGDGQFSPATETSETIDLDAKRPAWMTDAPLNVARANANTVLLPDGSMVTVGGGSGFDPGDGGGYVTYADGRARQVELYDPATKAWRLGPAQQEDRAYHSTAVLLPDGRVFSAGDDLHPLGPDGGRSPTDTAEIYSPPYLFNGPRPQIDSAPQAIDWGDAFGVASSSPNIDRAVLIAPGATTHGFDMNQRYLELRVLDKVDGKGVDVLAPPSPSAAPPGYYMLFLINKDGVPSVASWVRLDPQAPDQPLIGSPPAGDFNGDGFPDLAIAAPDAAVGSADGAGVVHVVYGSGGGLVGHSSQIWTQEKVGGDEAAASGNGFGVALATGDYNGDGFADLAVGAPGENVSSAADAGAVDVLYGSPDGLAARGEQTLRQGSGSIADAAESGDRFGAALAAGDLNGDGSADLAVGAPSEGVESAGGAGAVNVIYGSSGGLTDGGKLWTQNSDGILDRAEAGDSFGAALGSGDLNGDGSADLAVGVPAEGTGRVAGSGAVNVIYGSSGGLTAAGNQLWTQNSAGILDRAEAGDSFGSAIGVGELDGDRDADLAVGAPAEGVGTADGAGAVNVIYGSSGGLTAAGNQLWTQNSAGILDRAEAGDSFGSAIGISALDGDGVVANLAIGAPGEGLGGVDDAGAVNVIDSSGAGLTAAGNQLWSQDSAQVLGTAEAGDGFGSAIAAADLDRDGRGDLAVGVPADTVGDSKDAGSANVLYGSDGGLGARGNQLWNEDSADLNGPAATDERFGAALGASAG